MWRIPEISFSSTGDLVVGGETSSLLEFSDYQPQESIVRFRGRESEDLARSPVSRGRSRLHAYSPSSSESVSQNTSDKEDEDEEEATFAFGKVQYGEDQLTYRVEASASLSAFQPSAQRSPRA